MAWFLGNDIKRGIDGNQKQVDLRKSKMSLSMSELDNSGISTLGQGASGLPSRAQRARRRMESFSPKLTLSSEGQCGKSGIVTPMISADSWRVDTEERRR